MRNSSNPNSRDRIELSSILVIAVSILALMFAGAKAGLAASHGVGVCMTGVKIKANAGQGYEQILEYYYTGAEMVSGEADREIRAGVYSSTDLLTFRPTSSFIVEPIGLTGGSGDSVVIKWIAGIYEVTVSNGQIGTSINPPVVNAGGAPIYVNGWIGWNGAKTDTLKGKGKMEARLSDKDGKLWAVNLVGLEDYVAGMLEEPDSWPMEGLKTVAVAARTYAIYKQSSSKHGSGIPMCATGDCQQYHGDWDGPNHKLAASQTAGQVMKYNGEIIVAAYSGYCGGYTKSNAQVWGGVQKPYLVSVQCVCNTSAPPPPGNLRGFLINSSTRKGINGSAISVAGKVVPTIASGEFRINGIEPGEYTVRYDAPGYQGQTQEGIVINSSQTTTAPTCIISPPTGTISGRVTDAGGRTIPGASIRIGASRLGPDASGRFSFTKVYNGLYILIYDAPGYVTQEQVIRLEGGQQVQCPTCLLSVPGGTIAGRVVGEDWKSIVGASVRIDASRATVRPDGTFSFTKVWDGNYTLIYEAAGYQPQTQVIGVATGKISTCPTCLLGRGGEIVGRVLNTKGQVVPGTCIRINASLMPTNPGGDFRFTMVHPGLYTIYFDAPGYKGQQQEITVGTSSARCPTVILST